MAAVIVNAVQGEIWFDGMRFSGEPIKFPHGMLSAEQLNAMRDEGSGLIVHDWTDAPPEYREPESPTRRRASSAAQPAAEASE